MRRKILSQYWRSPPLRKVKTLADPKVKFSRYALSTLINKGFFW
jgi:hypothetical protein